MEQQDAHSLGDRLRTYRERSHLTQEELAGLLDPPLSVDAISKVERGLRRPRRPTLLGLLEALQLDAQERRELLRIWRDLGAPAGTSPPVAHAPRPLSGTLLPPVTPLVDRDEEQTAILRLLQPASATRLLTVTGPGGVGKTHLVQHVARALAPAYADGIVAIDLAPIRDTTLVLSALLAVLGGQERGHQALDEQVIAAIGGKHLLLVLDNMEQVVAAGPILVALLAQCPRLVALVTSRAALRVRGEYEVALAPLALPDPAEELTVDALARSPAVALFVQRAQAVRAEFALSAENAATVAAICARLDGLPLALELAAARLKLFAPRALLARLTRRLPVLVDGARDLPTRQRALRDTVAWSHDLLAPGEQVLFRRLAVFAGGASLAAAEAICGSLPAPGRTVWEEVGALADQSLIRLVEEADGEPRLAMLETIRDYARERLVDAGELDVLRRAHATYYLDLVERTIPALTDPDRPGWLEPVDLEQPNLRAALAWTRFQDEDGIPSIGQEAASAGAVRECSLVGLRLATALGLYWWQRGQGRAGRTWLEELLAQGGDALPTPIRARALRVLGMLATGEGDYGAAGRYLEECLDLERLHGDALRLANAQLGLGHVRREQGDLGAAHDLYAASLEQFDALGQTQASAQTHSFLGTVAQYRGEMEEAARQCGESLRLHRALQDRRGTITALSMLALVAREQGTYARALELAHEALTLARAANTPQGIALALLALGHTTCDQGDWLRAAAYLGEALRLCDTIGYLFGAGMARSILGLVVQGQGDLARAGGLGDEALALFRTAGNPFGLMVACAYRARVAVAQGDGPRARQEGVASLALARQLGIRRVAAVLEALAATALLDGAPDAGRAAFLLGAASTQRAVMGIPVPQADQHAASILVTTITSTLGTEAYETHWAAGQSCPIDDLLLQLIGSLSGAGSS